MPPYILLHLFLNRASFWDRPKLSMSFLAQSSSSSSKQCNWYQPMGGDAWRLGRKGGAGRKYRSTAYWFFLSVTYRFNRPDRDQLWNPTLLRVRDCLYPVFAAGFNFVVFFFLHAVYSIVDVQFETRHWCTSGCVAECRICNREVAGSNLCRGYTSHQGLLSIPSLRPVSVTEYQLRLGRQRQVQP